MADSSSASPDDAVESVDSDDGFTDMKRARRQQKQGIQADAQWRLPDDSHWAVRDTTQLHPPLDPHLTNTLMTAQRKWSRHWRHFEALDPALAQHADWPMYSN